MPYPDHLHNRIREISEKMGIDSSEVTVVKMSSGSDERHRSLELIEGSWNKYQPWIIVDEEEQVYALTSFESIAKLIGMLTVTQSENFQHKLEKAIWQRLPIDFEDVWEVAMDRIRTMARTQSDSTVVNIDLDWLISEIKQKYPNLFYHLDQILGQK